MFLLYNDEISLHANRPICFFRVKRSSIEEWGLRREILGIHGHALLKIGETGETSSNEFSAYLNIGQDAPK